MNSDLTDDVRFSTVYFIVTVANVKCSKRRHLLSADNLCKQFGSKLFDTLMAFQKEFFDNVFEKISRRQKIMQNY